MIKTFVFNHFAENTFVVYNKQGDCVIIDPGNKSETETYELTEFIASKGLSVKGILLTHPHLDHFTGAKILCETYSLTLSMHKEGERILTSFAFSADAMGFPFNDMDKVKKNFLEYNTEVSFGSVKFRVLDVSGHAPGSIAYYCQEENGVFVGDAVFFESIGRTDLIGGDLDLLINNIRKNIFTLPLDTDIYSGHGPKTDVDYEAANNPYINGFDF
ncbi:MAG: MBL fold metallo-hydrolase [Bacteroidales bacterium]|nr:MBL fold metallo-hydrolase [Bacteroidales bacterium]